MWRIIGSGLKSSVADAPAGLLYAFGEFLDERLVNLVEALAEATASLGSPKPDALDLLGFHKPTMKPVPAAILDSEHLDEFIPALEALGDFLLTVVPGEIGFQRQQDVILSCSHIV